MFLSCKCECCSLVASLASYLVDNRWPHVFSYNKGWLIVSREGGWDVRRGQTLVLVAYLCTALWHREAHIFPLGVGLFFPNQGKTSCVTSVRREVAGPSSALMGLVFLFFIYCSLMFTLHICFSLLLHLLILPLDTQLSLLTWTSRTFTIFHPLEWDIRTFVETSHYRRTYPLVVRFLPLLEPASPLNHDWCWSPLNKITDCIT